MRPTLRTRYDFKSFTYFEKNGHLRNFHRVALLTYLRKVKPSLHRKMIKLLTSDNLFPPLHSISLAKTHIRMMTAITFSHQNDAGSRKRTKYLVLIKSHFRSCPEGMASFWDFAHSPLAFTFLPFCISPTKV